MANQSPVPVQIHLLQQQRLLQLEFSDGAHFSIPCELLRVFSPSAEVQGHHNEGAVLQVGKEDVNITDIQQIGHYAIKIFFDDRHKSGLFTWEYLYHLGRDQAALWDDYLARLNAAGHRHRSQSGVV
jgi:DUF971 family protein